MTFILGVMGSSLSGADFSIDLFFYLGKMKTLSSLLLQRKKSVLDPFTSGIVLGGVLNKQQAMQTQSCDKYHCAMRVSQK